MGISTGVRSIVVVMVVVYMTVIPIMVVSMIVCKSTCMGMSWYENTRGMSPQILYFVRDSASSVRAGMKAA